MQKFLTHIRPPSGFSLGLRELWQYRELFYFFTWRDVKVKYKQTYLGIIWALLQPLGMMIIFTLLFSRNWKIDTSPVHYPVFVLGGLVCWNLFNSAVSHAGDSMIQHAHIIKKIYFPRLIIPCSAVLVALVDCMIALIIFLAICIWYHQPITVSALIYLPAGILLTILAGTGLGTLLAALNVKYRDFRYALPFLLQVLFFGSQVVYPLASIEQGWLKTLLSFNPMNAAIELFRAPFTGNVDTQVILLGLCTTILLLITGIFYFRKTENYFADLA